ncbi:MAG: hypothetical protein EA394_01930 [Bacteroidia bacterium]|nr:MAG: hypothetical protein EA394_01930 [Bacteroidia bacterium]
MNTTTLKDDIVRLLEEIVNRSHRINHHHPAKDLLLEIDLAQDDLRMLYRRLEMLKALTMEAEQPNPADLPIAPAEDSTNVDAKTSPVSPEVEDRALEPPDAGREEIIGEKEDERVFSDPEHQIPASEEQEKAVDEHDDNASVPASGDHTKEVSSPAEQNTSIPATPPPPPPPVEKEKSGNGNKALIDILAQYRNTTIGDQYLQEDDNSLHKRIASNKEDRSIGTRMQQQPIKNLKEVIGVNEKFLFINELFNGNIQEYHQAIANLNEMNDIRTAFDYLNKLGMEHSWDAGRSATTIEKLANYVQRRYMHQ